MSAKVAQRYNAAPKTKTVTHLSKVGAVSLSTFETVVSSPIPSTTSAPVSFNSETQKVRIAPHARHSAHGARN